MSLVVRALLGFIVAAGPLVLTACRTPVQNQWTSDPAARAMTSEDGSACPSLSTVEEIEQFDWDEALADDLVHTGGRWESDMSRRVKAAMLAAIRLAPALEALNEKSRAACRSILGDLGASELVPTSGAGACLLASRSLDERWRSLGPPGRTYLHVEGDHVDGEVMTGSEPRATCLRQCGGSVFPECDVSCATASLMGEDPARPRVVFLVSGTTNPEMAADLKATVERHFPILLDRRFEAARGLIHVLSPGGLPATTDLDHRIKAARAEGTRGSMRVCALERLESSVVALGALDREEVHGIVGPELHGLWRPPPTREATGTPSDEPPESIRSAIATELARAAASPRRLVVEVQEHGNGCPREVVDRCLIDRQPSLCRRCILIPFEEVVRDVLRAFAVPAVLETRSDASTAAVIFKIEVVERPLSAEYGSFGQETGEVRETGARIEGTITLEYRGTPVSILGFWGVSAPPDRVELLSSVGPPWVEAAFRGGDAFPAKLVDMVAPFADRATLRRLATKGQGDGRRVRLHGEGVGSWEAAEHARRRLGLTK